MLPRLAQALRGTRFYLAGGTGLALQIGHRTSVDFDWFIQKLGQPEMLLSHLNSFDIEHKVDSISSETVYMTIGNVLMSFIGYDYPLLNPVVQWHEYGVSLASLEDIACMKLSAPWPHAAPERTSLISIT